MKRPNYGNSNPGFSSSQSRGYSGRNISGAADSDIESILTKIRSVNNLADLPIEEIAKEDGIADKLATNRKFRQELKTTQLRKFFDSIVNNQEKLKAAGWEMIESDFYMIRPNLAYAKGRKLIPDEFFKLVSLCLEKVNTKGSSDEQRKKNYDRFVELMQALVAYTKYYER